MNALFKRINQPTELRAILDVFRHFFLYDSQPLLLRAKLNNKVGTQRGEAILLCFGKSMPALSSNGAIQGTFCSIGRRKSS